MRHMVGASDFPVVVWAFARKPEAIVESKTSSIDAVKNWEPRGVPPPIKMEVSVAVQKEIRAAS